MQENLDLFLNSRTTRKRKRKEKEGKM